VVARRTVMVQSGEVKDALLIKVSSLFEAAVKETVTASIRKYKASNDSLRKELAEAKFKAEGMKNEFKPQVERAKKAETRATELEQRVRELNLTVQALQIQNAKLQTDATAKQ